jgi:hypothetical protein
MADLARFDPGRNPPRSPVASGPRAATRAMRCLTSHDPAGGLAHDPAVAPQRPALRRRPAATRPRDWDYGLPLEQRGTRARPRNGGAREPAHD